LLKCYNVKAVALRGLVQMKSAQVVGRVRQL
jgi:hypothetical protein